MTADGPLADRISIWMQDRVREAGAKGIVLGLSGGLDSAVCAALAMMAVGDEVLGLQMPCHSSPDAARDAMLVARKLGLRTHTADLTAAYDALASVIPCDGGIELTNIPPRLRMTALYCAAQSLGYLVCGTSNRSEILIGYFTKWGDGAADIKPIGGLYKTEVFELARDLGIPEPIIAKPPTADLRQGQTDEGDIGMTYRELDTILAALDSGDLSGLDQGKVERVREMIRRTEHKRSLVPTFHPIHPVA